METNILLKQDEELNNLSARLGNMAGKHVSRWVTAANQSEPRFLASLLKARPELCWLAEAYFGYLQLQFVRYR